MTSTGKISSATAKIKVGFRWFFVSLAVVEDRGESCLLDDASGRHLFLRLHVARGHSAQRHRLRRFRNEAHRISILSFIFVPFPFHNIDLYTNEEPISFQLSI